MTRIKQTLQPPVNDRYRTVTAALCPTPGQDAKSMLNQALRTTEIRYYPPQTGELAAQTKSCTTVPAYRQPSAGLQSP
jgi:hypothetical protein